MRVTQQDVAEKVGLSRTTVTKILNRDPRYITSEDTRQRVYKAAEELGYNFTQVRRPFRREYGRADMTASAIITIVFKDGEVFDKGTATVRNVSAGGALLTDISLPKSVLPLRRFSIIMRIRDVDDLADLVGECEIVRFFDIDGHETAVVGVRFLSISKHDRKRIEEFVNKFGEKTKTAPLLPKHEPVLRV
ncbi:MAG: LacI family DNA-binding transcriptional regulator [Planctomycetota bacterium]